MEYNSHFTPWIEPILGLCMKKKKKKKKKKDRPTVTYRPSYKNEKARGVPASSQNQKRTFIPVLCRCENFPNLQNSQIILTIELPCLL